MPDSFMADMQALMKGTNAHLVSDMSAAVMNDREKIPTPIPALNCIFGGGLPLGLICEAYGDPASGKSSTWYQTMGNFQKAHPDGISIIIDTEASVDTVRMPKLDVDPARTVRVPSDSLEKGFETLFQILDNKQEDPEWRDRPVMVLWDTISVGATEKQLSTGQLYGGGMSERPRILKNELQMLMPRIEKQPMLVVLLNQVTTEMTQFGGRISSGGGWAIKHNAHVRIRYIGGKTEYEDDVYATYKNSIVTLEKSKISPLFKDIPILINVKKSGSVDGPASMAVYAADHLGYIDKKGSRRTSKPLALKYPEYADSGAFGKFCQVDGASFYMKEYIEYARHNEDYETLLELAFAEDISSHYETQADVCADFVADHRKRLSKYLVTETDVRVGPNGDVEFTEVPETETQVEVDPDTGEVIGG